MAPAQSLERVGGKALLLWAEEGGGGMEHLRGAGRVDLRRVFVLGFGIFGKVRIFAVV